MIGPNIYEADRFATAAFAMGRDGILFIEELQGFEGYMIDRNGMATLTSGFAEVRHAMIRFIDNLLNRITMYRLVLYYLIFLLGAASVLCVAGISALRSVRAAVHDRLPGRRLLDHQRDLRLGVPRSRQRRVGLHLGADPGADHHAADRAE